MFAHGLHPVATAVAAVLMVGFTIASVVVGVSMGIDHGIGRAILWFGLIEWPAGLIFVVLPVLVVHVVAQRVAPRAD